MAEQSPGVKDLWLLDGLEDFREHSLRVLQQARRRVNLLSQDLDPQVLAESRFIDGLSALARSSRYVQIQVLLRDTRLAKEISHPLVKLAQRLSTKIEIRKVTQEPENNAREFLCCDDQWLVYKNDFQAYRGFANYAAWQEVKRLRDDFTYLWEYGEPEPDFQLIYI